MSKYWEIAEGEVDGARSFERCGGTSLRRPLSTLRANRCPVTSWTFTSSTNEEGDYLPARQTLFPRSRKFRCHFSASFAAGLSALAEKHAEAELLDHVALYDGSREVLSWHDAFANVLLISRSMPEWTVSAFAADLGLRYS
jgi:hypothetical protein